MAKGAAGRRKILTGDTGNLGRSIRTHIGAGVATVYSDLSYSAAHNEGTSNAGRGRKTKIPQRKFIGDHPQLQAAIRAKIEIKLKEIIKP